MAPHQLDAALEAELARWRAAGLERELPDLAGTTAPGIDFTSNDYLDLARHPAVIEGARRALEAFGAGARASRLLGGGSPADAAAERAAADWLGAETALLFPSGYHANLGLVGALAGPGDRILSDELNHASLVDGVRLARARVEVYRHADVEHLEALLALPAPGRTLVLTESVFSMDGDLAPLAEIAEICERSGAALVVDEAHAAGLLGDEGAGGWSSLGVDSPALAARVVTGGKALGVAGALVCSSARVRELLVNRARSFAFTTAAPPAVAGGLAAAIAVARKAVEARARCLAGARQVAASLDLPTPAAAIVPVVLGSSEDALAAAAALRERDLDARAVRPPTVPSGSSRLRVVCRASHTEDELGRLIEGLRSVLLDSPTAAVAPPLPRAPTLFVTGTDTCVGKTVVSALLARAAARLGPSYYWKPVQTGDESDTSEVTRLAACTSFEPGQHFPLPASPHEAAREAGSAVDLERLDRLLDDHSAQVAVGRVVCELAGGLLVPLTDEVTQLDWLARRRPPLVLVARSGLGTLNHTLLSLEALRRRQLEPRALFLVGPRHDSNRDTLAARGQVPRLFEVPVFGPLDTRALDAWLADNDLAPLFDR